MKTYEVLDIDTCPDEGFNPTSEKCSVCINYILCNWGGNEGLCFELDSRYLDQTEE